MGIKEATLTWKEFIMADFTKTNRGRAKSQGFAAFGIPVGSTLVFKKDSAVTVKTLDGKNKVEYLGGTYSISTLAKRLVGSPVSGYLYFKFEGKALRSLAKSEVDPVIIESAGSPVSEPAEEASEAPEASMEQVESGDAEVMGEFERGAAALSGKIEVDADESADDKAESRA